MKNNHTFSYINPTYLLSISQGDIPFIEKIHLVFINQTKVLLEQLQKQLNDVNFNQVVAIVHKMKSSFKVLGVSVCDNDILYVETYGVSEKDIEKMQHILKKIDSVCLHVNKEMIIFIQNLKNV